MTIYIRDEKKLKKDRKFLTKKMYLELNASFKTSFPPRFRP